MIEVLKPILSSFRRLGIAISDTRAHGARQRDEQQIKQRYRFDLLEPLSCLLLSYGVLLQSVASVFRAAIAKIPLFARMSLVFKTLSILRCHTMVRVCFPRLVVLERNYSLTPGVA